MNSKRIPRCVREGGRWLSVLVLGLAGCGQVQLSESVCGNGNAESPEECDGNDLAGASCHGAGLGGGLIKCTPRCQLDTSGCSQIPESCGDGVAESPEQCDGDDLAGASCESEGFGGGTLACRTDCWFDHRSCLAADAPQTCGDGVAEEPEQCDGNDFAGASCVGEGFSGGGLSCTADCALDTGSCCDNSCSPQGAERCATETAIEACIEGDNGCFHWVFAGDCAESIVDSSGLGVVCIGGPGSASCGVPCSEDRCVVGHTECQDRGLFACMPYGGCADYQWMAPCADDEACTLWREGTLVLDYDWVVASEWTGSDMGADFGDNNSFTGEGCGSASGPEAIFTVRLDAGQAIRLYETGGVNVRVRVVEACDPMGGCLEDADLGDDESEGVIFTSPEALGTYHIVFEAVESTPAPADYSFHVEAL